MAALFLSRTHVTALKTALFSSFRQVGSAHLTEALATALGSESQAALLDRISNLNGATEVVPLDDDRFAEKLERLGYRVDVRHFFDTDEVASRFHPSELGPDLSLESLRVLGQDARHHDHYYFCRVLKDRGYRLPGLISIGTLTPLLRSAGLVNEQGFTMIDTKLVIDTLREFSDISESSRGHVDADDEYVGAVSFAAESKPNVSALGDFLMANFADCFKVKSVKSAGSIVRVSMEIREPLTISDLYLEMKYSRIEDDLMRQTLRALPVAKNSMVRRTGELEWPDDWADNTSGDAAV